MMIVNSDNKDFYHAWVAIRSHSHYWNGIKEVYWTEEHFEFLDQQGNIRKLSPEYVFGIFTDYLRDNMPEGGYWFK